MKPIRAIQVLTPLSLFWLCSLAIAQNLNVTGTAPLPQSMVSANNLEITIDFDGRIDPTSVDNRTFSVFGRWTGVCPGTFTIENNNPGHTVLL